MVAHHDKSLLTVAFEGHVTGAAVVGVAAVAAVVVVDTGAAPLLEDVVEGGVGVGVVEAVDRCDVSL